MNDGGGWVGSSSAHHKCRSACHPTATGALRRTAASMSLRGTLRKIAAEMAKSRGSLMSSRYLWVAGAPRALRRAAAPRAQLAMAGDTHAARAALVGTSQLNMREAPALPRSATRLSPSQAWPNASSCLCAAVMVTDVAFLEYTAVTGRFRASPGSIRAHAPPWEQAARKRATVKTVAKVVPLLASPTMWMVVFVPRTIGSRDSSSPRWFPLMVQQLVAVGDRYRSFSA